MTVESQGKTIEEELDARHRQAQVHFGNRDITAYMEMFTPDLVYRQANGVEIGREQLRRDVQAQCRRIVSADSSYTRESLHLEEDGAIEHLVQTTSASMRVFVVFRRRWRVQRSGRYTWVRTSTGWKIRKAEILHESIAGDGLIASRGSGPAAGGDR